MRMEFIPEKPEEYYMIYTYSDEMNQIKEKALEEYRKFCEKHPIENLHKGKKHLTGIPEDF